MQRKAINPWNWSLKLGYNQAELITGAKQQLICSGQTSVDENGAPQHEKDMRAQIKLSLENLETILKQSDMSLSDCFKLTIYVTDMDAALENFDIIGQKFGAANNTPPMSLIGVQRLALPQLMFEIEAIAQN